MVFVRGQSQDYDTWAQLGNRGWSYREVLPIFKEIGSYQGDGDGDYRGRNGPLRVSESNESGALYDALIKAAGEVGIAYTKDYNGAQQDGIGMTQTTIRGGRRMSTAVCYLDSGAPAPEPEDSAQRADRMSAVRRKTLRRRRLRSRRAAIRSPRHPGSRRQRRLDQLAATAGVVGIGRPEVLQAAGIEVRHELRGVGENLRDHYSPRMKWAVPLALGMTYNAKVARPRHGVAGAAICDDAQGAWAARRRRSGPMSGTRAGLDAPDAAISWIPSSWSATISNWQRIDQPRL